MTTTRRFGLDVICYLLTRIIVWGAAITILLLASNQVPTPATHVAPTINGGVTYATTHVTSRR